MPTPFSHMVALAHLLQDDQVPPSLRDQLRAEEPAYLLGAVAPDARVPNVSDSRAATHFYSYQEGISAPPWRLMLQKYPTLVPPQSAAHRAFLAGYVAHLAMDEVWTRQMLVPHFANADWGENPRQRFFVLHFMLIDMDERDLKHISAEMAHTLQRAKPQAWLPFMPLPILREWQKLIYEQIKPNGESKTYEIFGERVQQSAAQMRRSFQDEAWMQEQLWQHVPRSILAEVEAQMFVYAREVLIAYWQEHAGR